VSLYVNSCTSVAVQCLCFGVQTLLVGCRKNSCHSVLQGFPCGTFETVYYADHFFPSNLVFLVHFITFLFFMVLLWYIVGDGGGGHWLVRMEWCPAGWLVSASNNLPLHHEVQKFSSGTGSPGWSRKRAVKWLWWCCGRLSWPAVSFWAHVTREYCILSYHICRNDHLQFAVTKKNRVAIKLENLEYSGISLNVENSWNSVQPQGKLTLCSGCSLCQAIHMQPSVSGAQKLSI